MLTRGNPDEVLEGVRNRGWLVGTTSEVVEQIKQREELGIQRIMLQHHAQADFDTLELIAKDVLPQVQR